MLALSALAMANYTTMANNMAFRGMMANNARLGLISGLNGQSFSNQQLSALSAMDTQLEIDALMCGFQYKYAKKMLEQMKKLQKDNIERSFSIFA